MRLVGWGFGVACACLAGVSSASDKKYVSFGWEFRNVTPEQLIANAPKLKAEAVDGVGIYLRATNSLGRELRFVSQGEKWEREAFAAQIPTLRRVAETPGVSESMFVGFGAPQKRLAWTDDAGWANFANSMAVLGWISRESGIHGFWCDHEDYYKQSQYYRLPGDPSWDELVKLVRRRGAQVFGALFKEDPNAKLLFCWALTIDRDYFTTTDVPALVKAKGDLWPAFFDGLLDALPPTATVIEGDEHSYSYEARLRGFHKSYANQREISPLLLAPENRARYLRQMQTSFAFYLDAYVNETGPWYFGPENGSRTAHFRRNLADATSLAAEYVWLWGERNMTIRWSDDVAIDRRVDRREKTWGEALSGLAEVKRGCKDADQGWARRVAELKAKGEFVDLIGNPGCEADGQTPFPKPYDSWKSGKDKNAVFFLDQEDGCTAAPCLALKGTKTGSILFEKTKASPGEVYEADVAVKGEAVTAEVRFKLKGEWQRGMEDVGFLFDATDARGWKRGKARIVVPEGTDDFVVIISSRIKTDENIVRADDFHLR